TAGGAEPAPAGDVVVNDLVLAGVGHDDDLPGPVAVLDPDPSGGLRDRRLALRYPRLEDLLDPGQTLGDVLTRDATGVEGTHGQLGARLTDRLRRDDADRLAHVDRLAGRQRPALPGPADPQPRLAGEHRAHPYRLAATGYELVHADRVQVVAAPRDHVARGVLGVLGEGTGVYPGLRVLVHHQPAVQLLAHLHGDRAVGT